MPHFSQITSAALKSPANNTSLCRRIFCCHLSIVHRHLIITRSSHPSAGSDACLCSKYQRGYCRRIHRVEGGRNAALLVQLIISQSSGSVPMRFIPEDPILDPMMSLHTSSMPSHTVTIRITNVQARRTIGVRWAEPELVLLLCLVPPRWLFNTAVHAV